LDRYEYRKIAAGKDQEVIFLGGDSIGYLSEAGFSIRSFLIYRIRASNTTRISGKHDLLALPS
jgi:hypothetical protein